MALIRTAIVEDEMQCRVQTLDYLKRYEKEHEIPILLHEYADGMDLTENFHNQYDIIFCDIQMKHMDGMKAAEYIRARDARVIIIFITNLSEYAIRGYDVAATGYLLKPINYLLFSRYMDRAMKMIRQSGPEYLVIEEKKAMRRFPFDEICYFECDGHYINIHMKDREERIYMSVKNLETMLPEKSFAKCSSGVIVNMNYVDAMEGNMIRVHGASLALSRSQKKPFAARLAQHLSGD